MENKTIIVPSGKCPLDVLADMGEQTRNCRIAFSDNVMMELYDTADIISKTKDDLTELEWKATKDYPSTVLLIKEEIGDWSIVKKIKADDIAFTSIPEHPDCTLRLILQEDAE